MSPLLRPNAARTIFRVTAGTLVSTLLAICVISPARAQVLTKNPSSGISKTEKQEEFSDLTSLIQIADQYESSGDINNAVLAWERLVDIAVKSIGADHPTNVFIVNKLAHLYRKKGVYLRAESLHKRALAISEKSNGSRHLSTAIILHDLAQLYEDQGFYAKADPLMLRALKIRETILGSEHPDILSTLNKLGNLSYYQGLYSKAEIYMQRALVISEKSLGSQHSDTATRINNLALFFHKQGLYAKAEPLYKRALSINEESLGTEHASVVPNLNNLAALYEHQGLYTKAESMYKRALLIYEKALGYEHPGTATILSNLAQLYTIVGLYADAEEKAVRALTIREKALGLDHLDTGISVNNLATIYYRQGVYDKAELYIRRGLGVIEKVLGPEHPDAATILNNLARLFDDQGLYSKAEPIYRRVLAIRERALGSEHPDTSSSINNLAYLNAEQGNYIKAEFLFKRGLAAYEKTLGPRHPATATSLNNLAMLFHDQGLYSKAEPLYHRALEINENALGLEHSATATILGNLGLLYGRQGNYSKGDPLMRRALSIQLRLIQREASYLAAEKRQSYVNTFGNGFWVAFSTAKRGDSGANLALFSRLNRQGLLQEIEKRQAQLASLPGPQQATFTELRKVSQQLASFSISPSQRHLLIDRQELLEKQLYRLVPQLIPRVVEVQQVASALPASSALIEFQRYGPFDGTKSKSSPWGKPRYLALVLKANGSVAAVDLGPAAVIEERIQQALRATQEQLSDANQLWGQVGKQVLDPLGPALKGVQTLFVSPDVELNRIPFAALPAPGGKALLADALQLRLLTTGRELLDLAQPRSQAKTAALVVANPAFDQLASNASVPAVRPADPVELPFGIGGQQRSADLATLRWSALPGTAKEGQAIAALTGATLLSGSQASATAIEKQAAPRILHIASHGYFLANQPASPPGKRSSSNSGLPPMGSLPTANLQGESPLLRSGIVLAGANKAAAGAGLSNSDRGDDGYLTALEITQLDWKGTELVVISACESGKGDIQAGEGVYGLKRAIAVAGARSSLLSLWKVDDAATAAFMQSFYEKLKTGQGRADALATTQREFRNHSIPGWRHPYVWAAFQLSGDWGPVPGI